jgi:hypothetical protein
MSDVPVMLGCLWQDTPANRRWLASQNLGMTAAEFENLMLPYKGSVAGACADCGRPIWIGPEGRKLIAADDDVLVLCLYCSAQAAGGSSVAVYQLSDKKPGE